MAALDRDGRSPADRLDSWKEIAEYLKRSDRTVRRWEAVEGLPVHRHHHRSSGTVYAFKSELDAWFATRRAGLEREPTESPAGSVDASEPSALSASSQSTSERPDSAGPVLPFAARRRWWWGAAAAGLVGLTILLIYVGIGHGTKNGVAGRPTIHALAVLPLANLTGDPAQDYFVDGMTEALITELAQMTDARVISRTSVIQYKAAPKPLPAIAHELDVDRVVEGAVARSGSRVRVTAQLIDATSDRHLWAGSYDRDLDDMIGLQHEIAGAIAKAVSGHLKPTRGQAPKSSRVDPAATDSLFRGIYAAGRGKLTDAIAYCKKAIAKQPDFAAAYAQMSQYYLQFEFVGGLTPAQYMSEAEAAARKALELDETLAEAHAFLAAVLYRFHWDWPESEKQFLRALELNPSYSVGHRIFSTSLLVQGRIKDAIAEAERARQLDPLSMQATLGLAETYLADAQYEHAFAELATALNRTPSSPTAHFALAQTYLESGKLPEATAEMQTAVSHGDIALFVPLMTHLYQVNGRMGDARTVVEKLRSSAEHRYTSPADIGFAYLAIDETDMAVGWLEKAVREHDPELLGFARQRWLGRLGAARRVHQILAPLGPASGIAFDGRP